KLIAHHVGFIEGDLHHSSQNSYLFLIYQVFLSSPHQINYLFVHISIVSPIYGCGKCLEQLVDGINSAMQDVNCSEYEIILIDDRSPDNPWPVIETLS